MLYVIGCSSGLKRNIVLDPGDSDASLGKMASGPLVLVAVSLSENKRSKGIVDSPLYILKTSSRADPHDYVVPLMSISLDVQVFSHKANF